MAEILEASKLTLSYKSVKALDNFDMKVEQGRITGLLGPNGSGKTTFMRVAAGLLTPDSGSIRICGEEPGISTKSILSYMPDVNHLYDWMGVSDAMDFYADFFNDFDKPKAVELVRYMKVGLTERVKSMSKGTIEKLNISLTLGRSAKLYLLDEPLGGIDPIARERMLDIILRNYNETGAVIITTHLIKDVERLFDSVTFISEGKNVLSGSSEVLREERGQSVEDIYKEVFQDA